MQYAHMQLQYKRAQMIQQSQLILGVYLRISTWTIFSFHLNEIFNQILVLASPLIVRYILAAQLVAGRCLSQIYYYYFTDLLLLYWIIFVCKLDL